MREITDHKLNGLNDAITISAIGEAGVGGANYEYNISLLNTRPGYTGVTSQAFRFHNGPISDGFNGISNETLLAVVIDRMRGFQSGLFKSRENAVALTKLDEAMMWLQKRTRERMARGVEGTHAK